MTTNSTIAQHTADRLAISEALYRYAAGIDLRDKALFASALTEDAVSDFRPAAAKAGFEYPVVEGREVLVEAISKSLGSLDTTHTVSNQRVVIDADIARMEALVEAQHVPRGDSTRHYLMKNRYNVDLVRSGDDWLIRRIVVDNVWRSGDPTVLSVV